MSVALGPLDPAGDAALAGDLLRLQHEAYAGEAALIGDDRIPPLREAVAASIERGVFGSPFILADGEPFWGSDRLDLLDDWLARGGW